MKELMDSLMQPMRYEDDDGDDFCRSRNKKAFCTYVSIVLKSIGFFNRLFQLPEDTVHRLISPVLRVLKN